MNHASLALLTAGLLFVGPTQPLKPALVSTGSQRFHGEKTWRDVQTFESGIRFGDGTVQTTAGGGGGSGSLENWHVVGAAGEPAFQNSWSATTTYVSATVNPVAFRMESGRLYFRGVLKAPASGGGGASYYLPIFTLPAAYRPAVRKVIANMLWTGSVAAMYDFVVESSGVVTVSGFYNSGNILLDGFTVDLGTAGGEAVTGADDGVAVQDEGVAQGTATTLNFVGSGVSTSVASGTATVTVTGGGGSPSGGAGAVQFSNGTAFASDATKFFWDDGNDRLGIGTSSPANTLHVAGSAKLTGPLNIENTGTSDSYAKFGSATSNQHSFIDFRSPTYTDYALRIHRTTAGDSVVYHKGALPFIYRNEDSGAWIWQTGIVATSERMRLTATGNLLLGGGADDGSNKLQVTGNTKVTGDLTVTGQHQGNFSVAGVLSTTANSSGNHTHNVRNSSNSGYSTVNFLDNFGTSKAQFGYGNAAVGVAGHRSTVFLNTQGIDFAVSKDTATTTSLRVMGTSGNVLVGTTADDGTNKLQVNGGIKAAGVIHSSSGGIKFPDNTIQASAAVSYTPGAWTGVSFSGGWGDAGAGYQNCERRIDSNGRVFLRGSATIGGAPSGIIITGLPVPPATLTFLVSTSSGAGQVTLDTSGNLTYDSGGGARLDLNQIAYDPA